MNDDWYDYDLEGLESHKTSCTIMGFIIVMLMTIAITCIVINTCNEDDINPPVKEISVVDSLNKINQRIDSNINVLDSIKHEEIKNVKTYSNDSTLELFKELVSE